MGEGAGPSSFGRQQRLSEITIEPIKNLGGLSKIGEPPDPNIQPPLRGGHVPACPVAGDANVVSIDGLSNTTKTLRVFKRSSLVPLRYSKQRRITYITYRSTA